MCHFPKVEQFLRKFLNVIFINFRLINYAQAAEYALHTSSFRNVNNKKILDQFFNEAGQKFESLQSLSKTKLRDDAQ